MTKAEVENLNQKLRGLHLLCVEDKERPGDGIELIFGDYHYGDELFKLELAYGAGDVWHQLIQIERGN